MERGHGERAWREGMERGHGKRTCEARKDFKTNYSTSTEVYEITMCVCRRGISKARININIFL